MPRLFQYAFIAFALLTGMARAAGNPPEAAPVVVASISPLHSLLANVMAGVGKPLLLMRPGVSPHDYVMRPSEAAMLARADLIFWVGKANEGGLMKPLSSLPARPNRHVVAFLDENFPEILPERPAGAWLQGKASPAPGFRLTMTDPHIWLDPEIAGKIVQVMVRELSRADPRHAAVYQENGRRTLARLAKLDAALRARLNPVKGAPFMVYHDAFQYFERRYGLNDIGAVALSPDIQPGARLVGDLKAEIAQQQVRCLFTEPQFSPALVQILLQGSGARVGVADPLGAAVAPGPEAYFQLLPALANSLASCLEAR